MFLIKTRQVCSFLVDQQTFPKISDLLNRNLAILDYKNIDLKR